MPRPASRLAPSFGGQPVTCAVILPGERSGGLEILDQRLNSHASAMLGGGITSTRWPPRPATRRRRPARGRPRRPTRPGRRNPAGGCRDAARPIRPGRPAARSEARGRSATSATRPRTAQPYPASRASVLTPTVGIKPEGGLDRGRAADEAGRITDPPVWVPSASGTMPAPTAAADPGREPPGVWPAWWGLRVRGGVERGEGRGGALAGNRGSRPPQGCDDGRVGPRLPALVERGPLSRSACRRCR